MEGGAFRRRTPAAPADRGPGRGEIGDGRRAHSGKNLAINRDGRPGAGRVPQNTSSAGDGAAGGSRRSFRVTGVGTIRAARCGCWTSPSRRRPDPVARNARTGCRRSARASCPKTVSAMQTPMDQRLASPRRELSISSRRNPSLTSARYLGQPKSPRSGSFICGVRATGAGSPRPRL